MEKLKAGFAKLDITGFMGMFLSGYFRPRYAKGVIDPLTVNAAAFRTVKIQRCSFPPTFSVSTAARA